MPPLPGPADVAEDDFRFKKILEILRSAFRVDFSTYRETTVRRRILRRMVLHTKDNLADYLRASEEMTAPRSRRCIRTSSST